MKVRKKLNSKTKSIKLPDYIHELLILQFMKTDDIYQYGSSVFELELYENKIYPKNDGCFWGVTIRLDKIKSLEHGLTLLQNMGYFPLLPSIGYIDNRYFDKFLYHDDFVSHHDFIGKHTDIKNYNDDMQGIIKYLTFLYNDEQNMKSLNKTESLVMLQTLFLLKYTKEVWLFGTNPKSILTKMDARLARQNT